MSICILIYHRLRSHSLYYLWRTNTQMELTVRGGEADEHAETDWELVEGAACNCTTDSLSLARLWATCARFGGTSGSRYPGLDLFPRLTTPAICKEDRSRFTSSFMLTTLASRLCMVVSVLSQAWHKIALGSLVSTRQSRGYSLSAESVCFAVLQLAPWNFFFLRWSGGAHARQRQQRAMVARHRLIACVCYSRHVQHVRVRVIAEQTIM